MGTNTKHKSALEAYPVWDRTVRVFHWVNVLCLIGLIGLGLMIYFNKNFGVSPDGKILLKTLHVYIGYIFVFNLSWRILWGFIGSPYARWAAILPFGKGYKKVLSAYLTGLRDKRPPPYLGHNPLARLMISGLFILLITQAISGLVLAGSDLYMPPFGRHFAEWVTVSGQDNQQLVVVTAGSKEHVDPQAYKEMRAFRKPFINTHKYAFYLLCLSVALHIFVVVMSEIKEKNNIISAMFSGKKTFDDKPVDVEKGDVE
ncbi:MAG: cytochrome b/b6 domain-containing protein [Gammaproteobacteria bacterium]|nr:cytochrome b/b6 domain-containing protein [Gammaproteobacteria bacterium]MBQ0838795.1 cytochrome b/b6 domain-containing protein [Gammaproteobacteria bacterium]